MKRFCILFLSSYLCLIFTAISSGCATGLTAKQENPSTVVRHVVLVWLKPEYQGQYLLTLMQASEQLAHIPGIRQLHMGPALPSERALVDDSFDLGLLFEFETVEQLSAYVDHPDHVAFLKTYVVGKTKKVLIYDF